MSTWFKTILVACLSLTAFLPLTALASKPIHVGIATASSLKVAAAKAAFARAFPGQEVIFHTYKVPSGVAEQPVSQDWGIRGAKNRLERAKAQDQSGQIQYWVSMENFIEKSADPQTWFDIAVVIVDSPEKAILSFSESVTFPSKFTEMARAKSTTPNDPSGYSVTSGQVIREHYKSERGIELPADDWHQHADFGGVSRAVLLENAVVQTLGMIKAQTEKLSCNQTLSTGEGR